MPKAPKFHRRSKEELDFVLFQCPKCKRQQYTVPFAKVYCVKCKSRMEILEKKG